MSDSTRHILQELRRLDEAAKLGKAPKEFEILGKAANKLEYFLEENKKLKARITGQRMLITSLHNKLKTLKAETPIPDPK